MKHVLRGIGLSAAALLTACSHTPSAQPPVAQAPVRVQVLAINDFHGNLMPPAAFRMNDPADPSKVLQIPVGGSKALATAVKTLRAREPNHVFVAAGDLIGASPLLSALFHDEPSLESLSLMGLHISAVGNHEFDKGHVELLRRIRGGCHPTEGCKGSNPYKGISFEYLAASTIDVQSGKTLLPAYSVRHFEGVPVAFIGLTLKGTPDLVLPSAIEGLRFDDEVQTVNRLVPELKAQGIEAIVVLIHEGGYPTGGHNECPGISGPIVDLTQRFDPAVDVVVSGHTHRAYTCRIAGKLVTSGDKYGSIVTEIELQLDRKTRDVQTSQAKNHLVRLDQYAPDADQTRLLDTYLQQAKPLMEREIGRLDQEIRTGAGDRAGGWPMGHLVADAQLAAVRHLGVELALTNTGGVRAPLPRHADGLIRFADLYTAQPFGNTLVMMTLSGAELQKLIESQWRESGRYDPLQPSTGLSYTWDARRPLGARIVPGSLMLNGRPVTPEREIRLVVNNFVAEGGDGFPGFRAGRQRQNAMLDVEALETYIQAQRTVRAPALDRIRRVD
ncbi:bifunctional metallophosphatase/5'-nucleotidase [Inhella gelatinilytica]|uniref:Bifunctional metallophosphatase/5'-nucleotidase n=1 Tax=Inhella gelatinilytica TaxID=2795030 RepID=A0A931IUB2_9BURK|nr:bifunctional metallophosphatase/5'-nucleotidase [Inhella gelatinilytica]MBH9552895.1 bifunctional metallophosphatase/5'-nucleotidase [Inhella gelatinilytica]